MDRIFKYEDFLIESKIELLLEANIEMSDNFIDILCDINTPLSNKLLDIRGKDIDVNTNYIDIDIEKDGFVKFFPDDKVEKIPFLFHVNGLTYIKTSKAIGLKNPITPEGGQEIKLVKKLTRFESHDIFEKQIKSNLELSKESDIETTILNSTGVLSSQELDVIYATGASLCIIKFEDSKGEHEVICHSDAIKRDINSIRPGNLKIGKLITALFTKSGIEIKPTELEDFVNKYKSIIKQKREKFESFKIVKGEDIRKYYLIDNYLNDYGTLGKSCMRYNRCQKYLDIYVENEENIQMVVLFEEEEKVTARAILWTDKEGRKIMDRIYTNDSSDEQIFKDFAKSNGFFHKEIQNSEEDTNFIGPNGETEENITIQLKAKDYSYYPYMDSMRFYDPKTGIITNDSDQMKDYILSDTEGGNGSCDECGGTGDMECDECHGNGSESCDECHGNGSESCDECEGSGEVECSLCDGEGKEECDYCDGNGDNDCSTCDGEGKLEGEDEEEEDCTDCGGSGKESCEHCSGEGSRDCGRCDGNTTVECRECRGEGTNECDNCGGDGNQTCGCCDGDGRMVCNQCQ